MSDSLIVSLTPARLRELMQQAGYRVEIVADKDPPSLRSATNGLGFDVWFSSRLPGDAESYVDVSFVAALRVVGTLSLEPVNEWNNAKRFGRLRLQGDLLVLDMHMIVVGGVTPAYVRTQIEVWDRMVQELITFLREKLSHSETPNARVA